MSAIQLGPWVLSSPRFAALLGVALFLLTAWLAARRRPRLDDWAWAVVGIVVVGARVGWVVENLGVYRAEPLTALYVWQGGFAPVWGLLAAFLYTVRTGVGRAAVPVAAVGLLAWGGAYLVTTPAPTNGVRLPTLVLTTLDGDPAPLATRGERPLVVNLWAPWCPPCRRETPMLLEVAGHRADVDFVLVDQGTGASAVRAFLARHDLSEEDVRLDPRLRLAALVGSVGLPTTLVFTPDGDLSYRHVGEISRAELLRRVNRAVSEAGRGP